MSGTRGPRDLPPDEPDGAHAGEEPPELDVGEPQPLSYTQQRLRVRPDDRVRGWLAGAFVAIFAVTVASALLVAALGEPADLDSTLRLLELLLPAETALLGSAVGFYFGSRS